MKSQTDSNFQTTVAARIAGEDIHKGDYVTVLTDVVELPSYLWNCSDSELPADEPVRMRYLPRNAGWPYKVIAVCLPFVYAKTLRGGINVIDTRQQQLVRLDADRSRKVWKRMRKNLKKKQK